MSADQEKAKPLTTKDTKEHKAEIEDFSRLKSAGEGTSTPESQNRFAGTPWTCGPNDL
jgi:hypothetical protein